MLDVGANFGYFALGAAAAGCRVIAWEPIELFRAFLHHGIALNNLTHLIRVRLSCRAAPLSRVGEGAPLQHSRTSSGCVPTTVVLVARGCPSHAARSCNPASLVLGDGAASGESGDGAASRGTEASGECSP